MVGTAIHRNTAPPPEEEAERALKERVFPHEISMATPCAVDQHPERKIPGGSVRGHGDHHF